MQGDIIAIVRGNKLVAEYKYDSWGNCTISFDTNDIADINPLRYRGYYYDTGTNLYYLQSRYYDANIGRFINADDAEVLTENDKIVLENNIYSFCYNDPVSYLDKDGHKVKKVKKAKIAKVNCKYDRVKALNYMMKWYNGRNTNFYDGANGDCANFVSQCMNAGGMKMNDDWKCKKKGKFKSWFSRTIKKVWSFGYDYTKSWGLARSHYDFFKNSFIVHRKYTIYSADQINKYFNNWNIRPGDIVYYFKKKGDTKAHHVAIVSRIFGPDAPLTVAQHSDNYLYRDVRDQFIDNYKIVILSLNDNIMKWNRM